MPAKIEYYLPKTVMPLPNRKNPFHLSMYSWVERGLRKDPGQKRQFLKTIAEEQPISYIVESAPDDSFTQISIVPGKRKSPMEDVFEFDEEKVQEYITLLPGESVKLRVNGRIKEMNTILVRVSHI